MTSIPQNCSLLMILASLHMIWWSHWSCFHGKCNLIFWWEYHYFLMITHWFLYYKCNRRVGWNIL